MHYRVAPPVLIGLATLFVVMGDLRNLVSALGYWTAWIAWLVVSVFMSIVFIKRDFRLKKSGVWGVSSLIFGFYCLFFSFELSAAINGDVYTAYQGTKFIAIALLSIFIFFYSRFLGARDFYFISLFSIVISFLVFEYSRNIRVEWYVELGDGRQGDIIAYPGVLWKAGAFFIPFLIARLADDKGDKVFPLVGILLGVYLIIQDGSRTGFLWVAICMGIFAIFSIIRTKKNPLLILLFGGCFLSIAIGMVWFWILSGSSLESFPLIFERLSEGDSLRSEMINDGIFHVESCLPFGCGFGTAVSATSDGPMVIHNAFLSSAGDVGVLGLLSLLFLIIYPLSVFVTKLWEKKARLNYYQLAALMGILGFAFLMLLHPLSSEMSEWGLYLIMVSWLGSLFQCDIYHGAMER